MHAGFNLGGFEGNLGDSPSLLSQGPGHTYGNKTPAVTLTPSITQLPAFHHGHKSCSVSPAWGVGCGESPGDLGPVAQVVSPLSITHKVPFSPNLLSRPSQGFSAALYGGRGPSAQLTLVLLLSVSQGSGRHHTLTRIQPPPKSLQWGRAQRRQHVRPAALPHGSR